MAPVRVAASIRWVAPRLAGVGKAVGENEAAFGVGVDDFDGFAGLVWSEGHGGLHVAGLLRLAVGHVLSGADDGDDAHLGLEQGDGAHGAEHGRAAGHVVLHLLHVVGGLDGDAAGVEGDAFADQAEHGAVGDALGLVAQHDQRGRLSRALGDAPECAHLQLVQLVGGVDFAVEADFFCHGGGARPRIGGGELVAGLVDQRAGEVLALADDDALARRRLRLRRCCRVCRSGDGE